MFHLQQREEKETAISRTNDPVEIAPLAVDIVSGGSDEGVAFGGCPQLITICLCHVNWGREEMMMMIVYRGGPIYYRWVFLFSGTSRLVGTLTRPFVRSFPLPRHAIQSTSTAIYID